MALKVGVCPMLKQGECYHAPSTAVQWFVTFLFKPMAE